MRGKIDKQWIKFLSNEFMALLREYHSIDPVGAEKIFVEMSEDFRRTSEGGKWKIQDGILRCPKCGRTAPYDVEGDLIEYWPNLNFCPNCGENMSRSCRQRHNDVAAEHELPVNDDPVFKSDADDSVFVKLKFQDNAWLLLKLPDTIEMEVDDQNGLVSGEDEADLQGGRPCCLGKSDLLERERKEDERNDQND